MEKIEVAPPVTLRRPAEARFLVAGLVMISQWAPTAQTLALAALIEAWLSAPESQAIGKLKDALAHGTSGSHLMARRAEESAQRVDFRGTAPQLIVEWASSMASPISRVNLHIDFVREEFRTLLDEALTPHHQIDSIRAAADQDEETFIRRFSKNQGTDSSQAALDLDFMDLRTRELLCMQVFFGTNRARGIGNDPRATRYANAPGEGLNFGVAEVTLPHDHQAGHLERPWSLVLKCDEDQRLHVVIQQATSFERGEWLERGKAALKNEGDREALLFVHGYNVTFDDAIRRTAQLAYDLKLTVMPLCFSWASLGQLFGYMSDEDTIRWSVDHLKEFLGLVMSDFGLTRLHIVAHSMGNRAVVQVLHDLSAAGGKLEPLSQIVLAAPDVPTLLFRQQSVGFNRYERVTMYASRSDWAIRASALMHSQNRASDGRPPLVVPFVETIDVSSTAEAIFDLGHGYIASTAKVFTDLFEIVNYRTPAAKRQGPRFVPQGDYYVLE